MERALAHKIILVLPFIAIATAGCGSGALAGTAIEYGVPHLVAPCNTTEGPGQRHCETLSFGGVERNYRMYVPAKLSAPAPVVVLLHGYIQDAAGMEATVGKGIYRLADKSGALIVFPNSTGTHWRVVPESEAPSDKSNRDNVDDVGFLRALVASLSQRYPVDPERVFVGGYSNGGQMALRLACDAPDVYRGFASVTLPMRAELAQRCHPSVPARRVALFTKSFSAKEAPGAHFISPEATLAIFTGAAGCSGMKAEPWQPDKSVDESNVIVHRAIGCPDDLAFVGFQIKDMLHVWPGGMPDAQNLAARIKAQQQPQEQLDANTEIWHFFGLDINQQEAHVSQTGGQSQ